MNAWVKGVGARRSRRRPRSAQESSESQASLCSLGEAPYGDFDMKVLVLGGGFGATAAKDLCELIEDRDDVGVLMLAKNNFFTFWPMVPGIVSSDIDARNVAQPLRRALITAGASFRRAEGKKLILTEKSWWLTAV